MLPGSQSCPSAEYTGEWPASTFHLALSVTGLVIIGGQWTPCLLAVQTSPPLPGARPQGQVTLQMVFQMTLKVPCKHWPREGQLLKVLDSTLGWTCVLDLRLCFSAHCGHCYSQCLWGVNLTAGFGSPIGKMMSLWFGSEVSPKGPCVEDLVPPTCGPVEGSRVNAKLGHGGRK